MLLGLSACSVFERLYGYGTFNYVIGQTKDVDTYTNDVKTAQVVKEVK